MGAELATEQVTLAAYLFNSAEIRLLLTPPVGTLVGDYDYTVTASASNANSRDFNAPASSSALGMVQVGDRAVQISIGPGSRVLLPSDDAGWIVTITNTGTIADVYDLTVGGIVALSGSFNQPSAALDAGEATTVLLFADDFSFALPITYTFSVAAISQADAATVAAARSTNHLPR